MSGRIAAIGAISEIKRQINAIFRKIPKEVFVGDPVEAFRRKLSNLDPGTVNRETLRNIVGNGLDEIVASFENSTTASINQIRVTREQIIEAVMVSITPES